MWEQQSVMLDQGLPQALSDSMYVPSLAAWTSSMLSSTMTTSRTNTG